MAGRHATRPSAELFQVFNPYGSVFTGKSHESGIAARLRYAANAMAAAVERPDLAVFLDQEQLLVGKKRIAHVVLGAGAGGPAQARWPPRLHRLHGLHRLHRLHRSVARTSGSQQKAQRGADQNTRSE